MRAVSLIALWQAQGCTPGVPSRLLLFYHGLKAKRSTKIRGLSRSWHTFVVNWQPGRITYLIDGRVRWIVAAPDCDKPMYLLMNLAVGGNYPGRPDGTTPFPASLPIDDVQVWRR